VNEARPVDPEVLARVDWLLANAYPPPDRLRLLAKNMSRVRRPCTRPHGAAIRAALEAAGLEVPSEA
jgi:hypothetical protein